MEYDVKCARRACLNIIGPGFWMHPQTKKLYCWSCTLKIMETELR